MTAESALAARAFKKVVALSGGVGGARLVHGLSRVLPPEALTVVVNTGDDFEHWGLHIAPDVDTVVYTLADLAHVERGWGLADESFATLDMVRRYGDDAWFQLGDRDLATHILRTRDLQRGVPLSAITARLAKALGVTCTVLPMADGPCRTMIETEADGTLPFQTWFVSRRTEPKVKRVRFDGRPEAAPGVLDALAEADVIVLPPSNPYVSIDPILSLPGVRDAILTKGHARIVAVSPIVGGLAIKGPLAEMIPALAGAPASAAAVAKHYGAMLAGMVVETGDEAGLASLAPLPVLATRTVMKSRDDSAALARETLAFAAKVLR